MEPVSRETVGGITGVELVRLSRWPDERGWFREVFRTEWVAEQFDHQVQLNLSFTRTGGLRGLHFHRKQWDWWIPVHGRIVAAVADLRPGSATFLGKAELELNSEEPACLLIPPLVAHGFQALSDAKLLYAVNRFYDGTDEQGVAWDDPTLAVRWPLSDPILSDRDRNNPRVSEIVSEAR